MIPDFLIAVRALAAHFIEATLMSAELKAKFGVGLFFAGVLAFLDDILLLC